MHIHTYGTHILNILRSVMLCHIEPVCTLPLFVGWCSVMLRQGIVFLTLLLKQLIQIHILPLAGDFERCHCSHQCWRYSATNPQVSKNNSKYICKFGIRQDRASYFLEIHQKAMMQFLSAPLARIFLRSYVAILVYRNY